jgi:hypothetical protein
MLMDLVSRFESKKEELRNKFKDAHPSYEDIVKYVVETVTDPDDYYSLDPARIHRIDDGDYQGTLLFIIAATGYQPSKYWAVYVGYGSCSGCDTLQAIQDNGEWGEKPNDKQIDDYMTLALHIVQGLKEI